MPGMVASLSDADLRNLAIYFSTQIPQATDVSSRAASANQGESLYRLGDPSHGIPPCKGCHGDEASGPMNRAHQYAAYPALRGQYDPYVIARLSSFREGLPQDSSNDFIMDGIAQTLDDESIQSLAAWISSLAPTKSW
jgi:cytochrome c553